MRDRRMDATERHDSHRSVETLKSAVMPANGKV